MGRKTIGIAVCDPEHIVVTPLKTVKRSKFTKDILELEKLVRDYEIGGFVIGLPLNTDGSEGSRCQSVRDFAMELCRYPLVVGAKPWVALWDERFSTETVEDIVDRSLGISKIKAKSMGLTDQLAAQRILQTALEKLYCS